MPHDTTSTSRASPTRSARAGTTSSCLRRPRARPTSWPADARSQRGGSTASSRSRRAVPVSPRSAVGVPVGVRASVATALRAGRLRRRPRLRPGAPGPLVPRAPRRRDAHRSDVRRPRAARLPAAAHAARPAARAGRRLVATDEDVARRARASGSPATTRRSRRRRPRALRTGRRSATRIVDRDRRRRAPVVRAALRALRELDGWEAVLLRTARSRPGRRSRCALRDRVHVRTARDRRGARRAAGRRGDLRPVARRAAPLRLEAAAAGCALVEPPGVEAQPELAAAALLRLGEDAGARERDAATPRARSRSTGFGVVAERSRRSTRTRRRRRRPRRRHETEPLAGRDWIVADLHMHTSHSHDCSIEPARAARARRGRGARRDRGHRPQRLRRRARDGRARARPRPDRDPGRGGEDRRPGRGDRPLPRRGDPARHVVRRHGRGDP